VRSKEPRGIRSVEIENVEENIGQDQMRGDNIDHAPERRESFRSKS